MRKCKIEFRYIVLDLSGFSILGKVYFPNLKDETIWLFPSFHLCKNCLLSLAITE